MKLFKKHEDFDFLKLICTLLILKIGQIEF